MRSFFTILALALPHVAMGLRYTTTIDRAVVVGSVYTESGRLTTEYVDTIETDLPQTTNLEINTANGDTYNVPAPTRTAVMVTWPSPANGGKTSIKVTAPTAVVPEGTIQDMSGWQSAVGAGQAQGSSEVGGSGVNGAGALSGGLGVGVMVAGLAVGVGVALV